MASKGRPVFDRILLKISGEAFAGAESSVDAITTAWMAEQIAEVARDGVSIAVVVGGGNIWRGKAHEAGGMDRATADYMGMLATVINALALQDALERMDIPSRVQTAIQMQQIAEPYIRRRAIRHLEKGRVVIFGAGTGNPYFTTDTTAALRAVEIGAQAILKATKVDGIYSADPNKDATATRFTQLEYLEVLKRGLEVMDNTALTLCMDNDVPIVVFDMNVAGNIRRVVFGDAIGTLVGTPARLRAVGEDGNDMSEIDDVVKAMETRMQKAIDATRNDFASVRTGRASPALLDRIQVEAYGATAPLKSMASVSTPDARTLQITAFDRNTVGAIRKAIETSDLGLTPNIDGSTIRLQIPQPTEERRKDLVKVVKKKAEDGKVAVRNVRHKCVDELKTLLKDGKITEDDNKRAGERVQKVTDKYVKDVEALVATKEREILEV